MKFKCPECDKVFSEREALCEDWRNENKAFGCPGCATYFKKTVSSFSKNRLTLTIFNVGIAMPAILLMLQYPRNADLMSLLTGALILSSCLALAVINAKGHINFPDELSKVDP